MFYHLLFPLKKFFSPFNVFQYITFRSAGALLTALAASIILGYLGIGLLRRLRVGQPIRQEEPATHHRKEGILTMGGLFILSAILVSTLLWARLNDDLVYIVLFSMAWLGALGFIDDYLKAIKRNPKGLKARYKLIGQTALGLAIGIYFYFNPADPTSTTGLSVPFFKRPPLDLGLFYVPFITLVIVGFSNAVNLTDGMDGLAIGSTIIAVAPLAVTAYLTGHAVFSTYLGIEYIEGSGELTVLCAALIGASIGFLWFNANPAQVIMGDTGALALGGVLGTLAVATKKELLLLLVGGVFVIEAASVIIQWSSYRLRGKRFFRMAPIHYHYELGGMSEQKVVVRFWIIAGVLALVSLVTLKLR